MTAINFYILAAHKKLMPFVCQLTQTVLQKSDDSLIIVTPTAVLEPLDERLWSFSDTAFVPHTVIQTPQDLAQDALASVLLTDNPDLLEGFDGVVMNLTTEPLLTFVEANVGVKLLEIIAADELSLVHGRQKYRHYREQCGEHPLQTFQIN